MELSPGKKKWISLAGRTNPITTHQGHLVNYPELVDELGRLRRQAGLGAPDHARPNRIDRGETGKQAPIWQSGGHLGGKARQPPETPDSPLFPQAEAPKQFHLGQEWFQMASTGKAITRDSGSSASTPWGCTICHRRAGFPATAFRFTCIGVVAYVQCRACIGDRT